MLFIPIDITFSRLGGDKVGMGQGLAKTRAAEAELMELELEKDRPFARSHPGGAVNQIPERYTIAGDVRWNDVVDGEV
ncbi:uncharacterized protein LOC101221496 isoform X2 [Cucumis sativus]|uniref:uncharacterized protein LOC101221496 isoform X2 n=1 Tax=Cucumis sativus TaxID=3659 RepID=UPI0012F4F702|nr:uncharacterized protein LOC101221496 isoform X2 [Cucumis sativus]XP_031743785.1 uncharacterized protein LOC101221496 isoform X2 [Cucumis sativus]